MSIRVYSGPHATDHRARGRVLRAIPWVLALATVLAQIMWVLATDRFWWTHIVVGTFFLTSATHAVIHRGARWASAYIVITLAFGYGIELLGTTTGMPFGDYSYAEEIGTNAVPSIAGVPMIVPLAWAMMAYPALVVAWRVTGGAARATVALVGAIALTAWDFFLDPQMVAEGWWTWSDPSLHLPGIPNIPLQNFIGWLLATAILMMLLSLLPRPRSGSAVPTFLYLWMWIGGMVMNAVWLERPAVAAWGGVAMGLVAIPLLWRILGNRA
jgi:uncharacterized membrane protein